MEQYSKITCSNIMIVIWLIWQSYTYILTVEDLINKYFSRIIDRLLISIHLEDLNSLLLYKNTSKDVILNHDGSTVSDPSAIAEVFNNYFSNVASNLDRNIPHSNISPLNFLGAPVENSFVCAPSDREEIVNLIHRQKNKSTNLMNIPVFIYKILAPIFSLIVSMLFN